MAKLNLTQAAKAVGISRTTLYKDIEEKSISCELTDKGKKVIDPSELIRVYGELKNAGEQNGNSGNRPDEQDKTPETAQLLQQRITDLENQVDELRKDKEEMRKDKDANRKREDELLTIIKQQQALLPPPQQATVKKSGIFGRLFGK